MNVIQSIHSRIGTRAVLLPIPTGSKGPRITGWQETSFEQTQSPEWQSRLCAGNIGVLLGKASDGLCSIDIDDDSLVPRFLELNPSLTKTFRTRRSRGCNLWVRIKGDYRPSGDFLDDGGTKAIEWRADGRQTVVSGSVMDPRKGETKPLHYQWIVDEPAVEVGFDEIQWPDDLTPPKEWDPFTTLEEQYGPPVFKDAEGAIKNVNESFWAGLHAVENSILFEPAEREFWLYRENTGLYEVESSDAIRNKVSGRMLEESRSPGLGVLACKRSTHTLNAILGHLKGICEKRGAFADRKSIVHLANGVIEFKNGNADLKRFSPHFCSRNASPIAFDASASCPRFMDELVLPAVERDDAILLQKFAGMFLLGRNRAQRILILDGEAGRGKSTFAIVIQGIIGSANCTQLRTRHLSERFELFRFLRRTLLVGVDVSPDFLSTHGAAVLKGLVGGDWFDAEQKGGNGSFQVRGEFNVMITSNARLRVRLQGDVGAWRRRLNIVRFEAPPPMTKIPDFAGMLIREEGPGILNWCLQGAAMLLADVPDTGGDIRMTERQHGIVDSLLAESDSLRHFLGAAVAKEGCGDVSVAEVIEAYSAYCPDRGWTALSLPDIHEQLEPLMLELFQTTKRHDIQRDGKSVRGFKGVRLVPVGEPE